MSSHGENYYEILGVERTASGEEIRGAYRRLVQRAHPDTGGTGALFRLVRDAYAVLSDPERRRVYDELLTAPPGPVRVEETKEQAGPSAGGDGAGPDGREAAITPLRPPRTPGQHLVGWVIVALICLGVGWWLLALVAPVPRRALPLPVWLVVYLTLVLVLRLVGWVVLRGLGWLTALFGCGSVVLGGSAAGSLLLVLTGVLLWLAGNWLFVWHTGLRGARPAQWLFGRLPPILRPSQRWLWLGDAGWLTSGQARR